MSDVTDFGAVGDGRADDTEALQHAVDDGDGVLELPRGDYRITRPIVVDLSKSGRTGIRGAAGTAKILAEGPGPALDVRGTHAKTADPTGFRPEEWQRERMPVLSGFEIEGRHAEADGVRIEGVMQATLTGLLIREVRTAIHLVNRNRNLVVDHCHLYHNTGIGIHFDGVNLHQTCITGSHISYCRRGGIRIDGGEIRNLQITGCDIEYNNGRSHPDFPLDEPTAEIYVDVRDGSVREGTISSCTIQATDSPNGANIRLIGGDPRSSRPDAGSKLQAPSSRPDAGSKPRTQPNENMGMWTISGNLIGSQRVNVHLTAVRGVVLSGNYVYSGHRRNLLVEHSRNIVVGSNCFGHNPDYGTRELCTGLRFEDCTGVVMSGTIVQDCEKGVHTVEGAEPIEREGLVELVRCRRANLNGVNVVNPSPAGIAIRDCDDTLLTACTVADERVPVAMQRAIDWRGRGANGLVTGCRLDTGTAGAIETPPDVRVEGNVIVEP